MIEIHHFNDAHQQFNKSHISYGLLQELATITLAICPHNISTASNPKDISQSDIDWLLQQPEANHDYNHYLGGYVFVCESPQDLMHIQGCDFDWAEKHHGLWPNVTDMPIAWDVCNYVEESTGNPQWVIYVMCWNNAGGPTYYAPKHLWQQARVTEHIAATNPTPTP